MRKQATNDSEQQPVEDLQSCCTRKDENAEQNNDARLFAEMTMQIVGYRTEKRQETRHLLWVRDRRNRIPLAPLSSSNILPNAKRRKDNPRTAEHKSPAPQASSENRSVAREGRPKRRSRVHAQSPRSRGTHNPGEVHAEFLLCSLAFPQALARFSRRVGSPTRQLPGHSFALTIMITALTSSSFFV
jgi:hypothetical protein